MPEQPQQRCPNPHCDGTGWITCDATGTSHAYRAPACRVGPHRPVDPQHDQSDAYMVPELVLDPPDGIIAVWHPHARVIVVSDGKNEFTFRPAELRALNDWSRLHELHG